MLGFEVCESLVVVCVGCSDEVVFLFAEAREVEADAAGTEPTPLPEPVEPEPTSSRC